MTKTYNDGIREAAQIVESTATYTKEAIQKASASAIMENLVSVARSQQAYEIAGKILSRMEPSPPLSASEEFGEDLLRAAVKMIPEGQEQAGKVLHKAMNEYCSNFDKGAVFHWAERGAYCLISERNAALSGETSALRSLSEAQALLIDIATEIRAYQSPECEECQIIGPLLRRIDALTEKDQSVD